MKKITIKIFLATLFLMGAQVIHAQRTIKGTVISADDNLGIPGVAVAAKGTTTGTTTDIMGQYSLNVPDEVTTLVFSFMGMTTQEITIGSNTTIDVVMESSAVALTGVEIVGYGTARKVGTTVGSVQQVTSKKLEAKPVSNVMDALQGQMAGLQVATSTGDPTNSAPAVRLHGVGSLGAATDPLYVLDGIVVRPEQIAAMNPNDFESVTVLKDASATSIYGSKAANGVVVFTTKRGIRNSNAKITVRSQYGISKVAQKDYYDNIMHTEELLDFWLKIGTKTQAQIDDIRNNEDFINPLTGELYDTRWADIVMRDNAITTQTDISVQGGSEKTTYFISGNHYYQEGTAPDNDYTRYTARVNVESQAKDWLKVGMNVFLSRDDRNINNDWISGTWSVYGTHAPYQLMPFWTEQNPLTGEYYEMIPGSTYSTVHARRKAFKNTGKRSQLAGSAFVEITPLKGLKIISRAGTDASDYQWEESRSPSYVLEIGKGFRTLGTRQSTYMTTNNVIEYRFDINKAHNFSALVGHEGVLRNWKEYSTSTGNITDDRLMLPQLGDQSTRTATLNLTSYAYLSFFARADYSYKERFYADISVRSDAASIFGPENRNAKFWSIGGMWNMNNEKFIKPFKKWLTNATLKVSYGTQGNSSGLSVDSYMRQVGGGSATNRYDDQDVLRLTTQGNPGLTWENQSKLTAGIRASIWGKLNVELDYYNRRTSSMLYTIATPYTTGWSSNLQNVGVMQNAGIDLNLSMDFIRTRDFYVSGSFVYNYNRDKIIDLFLGYERYNYSESIVLVKGQPTRYYLPINAGIDPNTGKFLWYLPGDNIDVTTMEPQRLTDVFDATSLRQNTGLKRYAPVNGGFGVNAGWKGIQLMADFTFVLGKWMLDNTSYFWKNPRAFLDRNQSNEIWDYWTPENTDAKYPNWETGQTLPAFDSYLYSNASFLRLKNLTISYTIDQKILNKTKILSNARIFFVARNLLTFTKYSGLDPEIDGTETLSNYTNSKQFQFGLEFGF